MTISLIATVFFLIGLIGMAVHRDNRERWQWEIWKCFMWVGLFWVLAGVSTWHALSLK